MLDVVLGQLQADPGQGDLGRRLLASGGHVVGRPEHQPDPPVAQRDQMADRLLHRHRVVAADLREAELRNRRVHQHRRNTPLEQQLVVPVRRIGLRVQPAEEDHTGDLLLEQQLDVVRLGHAARGLRAEHRGEAPLRQGAADHLGEGGEDRVLQLRQDQADQSRALAAQLGRTLVAEHVQGGQHSAAGLVGDAGFAVEHPADRRLAHPDLLGHLGKSSCHGPQRRAFAATDLLLLAKIPQALPQAAEGF